jgi:hypothetical protein
LTGIEPSSTSVAARTTAGSIRSSFAMVCLVL